MLARSVTLLIVLGLAFVLSSCQGSTSDHQDPAPTESASAPPGQLGDWTDVDLLKKTSWVGYGANPKNILARESDGTLLFTPETPKDHIATQFINLPPRSGDRSLELSLDMTVAGGEACVANLQDQAYNVIATVPCHTTGTQQTTKTVPDSVKGVRVYFQSLKMQPIRLPSHMRLSEQR